jgi:hypothetical protein
MSRQPRHADRKRRLGSTEMQALTHKTSCMFIEMCVGLQGIFYLVLLYLGVHNCVTNLGDPCNCFTKTATKTYSTGL